LTLTGATALRNARLRRTLPGSSPPAAIAAPQIKKKNFAPRRPGGRPTAKSRDKDSAKKSEREDDGAVLHFRKALVSSIYRHAQHCAAIARFAGTTPPTLAADPAK
jgi:hypothetical protein